MAKVSVIIPVYNKEKYLRKSLDSVLKQSFRDYEIICVDDGSKDGSSGILREYAEKDSRIHNITIPNGGVSNARNVGLDHANGDWIQFLDADDMLCPEYLAKAVALAEENDIDVVFSDIDVLNEEYVRTGVKTIGHKDEFISRDGLKDLFLQYQYANGYFGFLANKLIMAELIQKNHIRFDKRVTLAEDLLFMVQVYEKMNRGLIWDGSGYQYLNTEANYLFRKKVDYDIQIEIQKRILTWITDDADRPKDTALIKKRISEYAYAILFEGNDERVSIDALTAKLYAEHDIAEYLSAESMKGFPARIVKELGKKNTAGIKRLFYFRTIVRTLYRRLKHGKKNTDL
ncbi:MAG: glycosyltransferase family 2 protein [Solobacterium sp.]|nr:glycosyltransferase family 2 protein [Solobacterium sp.]